jgi:uncharacterized membrane protein YedE/YeeE
LIQLDVVTTVLLYAFGLGVVFGALANKTNFCVMGAVSDMVNIGHFGRFRSWILAIALAIGGVALLEAFSILDMGLTTNNETSNPPYRTPMFVWPRYLLGGLLFGVGMTLGSGCGNKTMVRLGAGNLKSIVVLLCIAVGAYAMLLTDAFYFLFFQWMQPLAIDLTLMDIESQDLGALAAALTGIGESQTWRWVLGSLLSLLLLFWVFKSRDFRGDADNLTSGIVAGVLIVVGWYVTAGPLGQELLEEVDFMDERPFAAGAQSLTFIAPTAHAIQFVQQGFAMTYFTFALAGLVGVVVGSFLYAVLRGGIRFEWFRAGGDFVDHVVGGLLMGVGGILAMGCTVGQGMAGTSTLAAGSFLATVSIVVGSAVTMKYKYYRMLYEDASGIAAFITALVDFKVLPSRFRKLEAL